MYTSFIRPILEYADTVWDNCTQTEITEIKKIQTEAMRILTRATKSCSKLMLLEETGWDTLENRRYKHRLITMYNITHTTSPTYLKGVGEGGQGGGHVPPHFQKWGGGTSGFVPPPHFWAEQMF